MVFRTFLVANTFRLITLVSRRVSPAVNHLSPVLLTRTYHAQVQQEIRQVELKKKVELDSV